MIDTQKLIELGFDFDSQGDEEYKDSFSAYHKWRKHEIYLYPRMNRPDMNLKRSKI